MMKGCVSTIFFKKKINKDLILLFLIIRCSKLQRTDIWLVYTKNIVLLDTSQ